LTEKGESAAEGLVTFVQRVAGFIVPDGLKTRNMLMKRLLAIKKACPVFVPPCPKHASEWPGNFLVCARRTKQRYETKQSPKSINP
jgi:hypothetical protein